MTYYTSNVTYPSESYYEEMMTATVDNKGVMFIPKPPTHEEEGIVYCNIKGRNDTESDIIVGIRPGGVSVHVRVNCIATMVGHFYNEKKGY